MDSLDAQCLLIQLAEGEVPPPELWRHDRSGALSYSYEGGGNLFTWQAEHVAEMALTWRRSAPSGPPDRLQQFIATHERLVALAGEAGLGPADVITHRLNSGEIEAVWKDRKLRVVVDGIPGTALRTAH